MKAKQMRKPTALRARMVHSEADAKNSEQNRIKNVNFCAVRGDIR